MACSACRLFSIVFEVGDHNALVGSVTTIADVHYLSVYLLFSLLAHKRDDTESLRLEGGRRMDTGVLYCR